MTGTGALPLPMLSHPDREKIAAKAIATKNRFFMMHLVLFMLPGTQNSTENYPNSPLNLLFHNLKVSTSVNMQH